MDVFEKAQLRSADIAAMVANLAHIRLCKRLAQIGGLPEGDLEILRHHHLHDFDALLATIGEDSPETVRKAIHDSWELLDQAWQTPAQSEPSGGGSMR